MVVRSITRSDAKEIARLYAQFASYLSALGDSSDFLFTEDIYLRDGFGEHPAFYGIVIESEQKLLGYLLYVFGYDTDKAIRCMYIIDLLVDEKLRGVGIGKQLMAGASLICKEKGCKEMQWGVFHKNARALNFYNKMGAETINDLVQMSLKI
jgi:GNAT superfamily N-acetyltransferase